MLLIAEKALENNDLFIAGKMCNSLIKVNFSPAWSCVYKLAYMLARSICNQLKLKFIDFDELFNLKNDSNNILNSHAVNEESVFNVIWTNQKKVDEKSLKILIEIEKNLSLGFIP